MWCKSKTFRIFNKVKDRPDKSSHVTNFCRPKLETIATPKLREVHVVLNKQ